MIQFDEYEVDDMINEGIYTNVYKARCCQTDNIFAIKVLKNDTAYKDFITECELLLQLPEYKTQPNITQIISYRSLNGKSLIEMKYIEGINLDDFIRKNHFFIPINEVLHFANDICTALSYCHTNNIIHNDLHSKNIMRSNDGSYILLDFGMSFQSGTYIDNLKRERGAFEYKAPEKWTNGMLAEQVDIYSFGILLFEMLTGTVPFPLQNKDSFVERMNLRNQHLSVIPPNIELLRKLRFEAIHNGKWKTDYSDDLETVIMKCLAKKQENRYSNAAELHTDIQKIEY